MSAGRVLHSVVLTHLRRDQRVFDAPPLRASMPQVVLEEPVLAAADAAGVSGRIGTMTVSYADTGEHPVRLRTLIAAIEAAMTGVPTDLGTEGWRLAGLRLSRSRLTRGKADGWIATSEFAVRIFRVN